jgi:hypothetical protein
VISSPEKVNQRHLIHGLHRSLGPAQNPVNESAIFTASAVPLLPSETSSQSFLTTLHSTVVDNCLTDIDRMFSPKVLWTAPEVNPINHKARSIPFFNVINMYGRVFFFSWFGFFVAFWSWYAFPREYLSQRHTLH